MQLIHSVRPINRLLASLSPALCERLVANCIAVQLVFGDVVAEQGADFEYVYFPETSFISLVSSVTTNKSVETTLIGNEGVLGATLALGVSISPLKALVQGSGSALCISAQQFTLLLSQSTELRLIINRYLFVLIEQLAQNTACICFHEVRARLARWLLMTQDRAQGQPLHLTHQFLAKMLGVRRSAVSVAANDLQLQQFISYARGHIRVISRPDLEAISCACYTASTEAYLQQFPSSLADELE